MEYYRISYQEGQEELLYLDLADFADHVVNLVYDNDFKELTEIFKVIEKLHIDGDEYVHEAVTVGFLEVLQLGLASNKNYSKEDLLNLLGKETLRWWNKLERFGRVILRL